MTKYVAFLRGINISRIVIEEIQNAAGGRKLPARELQRNSPSEQPILSGIFVNRLQQML